MGWIYCTLLWSMAALVLTEYEVNVRVLRPWQRTLYAAAALLSGLAIVWADHAWRIRP